MRWLGVPMKQFNNHKEVEEYIRACEVSHIVGVSKDLGIPK